MVKQVEFDKARDDKESALAEVDRLQAKLSQKDVENAELKAASRESRAQEGREADVIHEKYDDEWEEPSLLDTQNIPPRNGYVQRWVRTTLNGKSDVTNVSRKFNQGWRPRSADTVPKGAYVPIIDHGQYGNVIGMEGMILMERPAKQHEAHGRANRRATQDQMRSVDESMFNAHSPNSGLGAPQRTGKSTVTRGRNVRVADD